MSLKINGSELIRGNEKVYVYEKPKPDSPVELISEDELLDRIFPGAYTLEGGLILLTRFDNGDDLSAFLHERGHASDLDKLMELKKISFKLDEINEKREKPSILNFMRRKNTTDIPRYSQEELDLYEKFMIEERNASIKAINEAESNQNLFPKDEGLFRMKKYLTTALMTYLDGNLYLSGAIREKANEIIRFD